jgi:hypothetical protein
MKLGSTEARTRKVLAIAALGVAGFCSATACSTAVQASSQPRPPSAAATDSTGLAQDMARIVAGSGGLAALGNGDGQAALAYCDPSTVSGRPDVGTPMSASCGINYSDGSVWRQTVTVTFDDHGSPVADRANLGTELLPPTSR